MRKSFTVLVVLLLAGTAGGTPVHAQTTAHLSLFNLQTNTFPAMSAGLDSFDSSGNFIAGLAAEQITLLEDGQPRPVNTLQETQPGAQFVLALDPGLTFSYRDAHAVSRFTKIVQAIQDWAATHADSLGDDLSLLPTGENPSTHLAETAVFSAALTAYSPNWETATSSLDTLAHALDVVSEPTSQAGMTRVILYITSLPTEDATATIEQLTQRAVDLQVRVNVWMVASQNYVKQSGTTALQDLALLTYGQFIPFSGEETLPSLETYLAPVRHAYQLTYTSNISTSGSHTLEAQIISGSETLSTDPVSFELNVQPPSPMLVSPPEQIVRKGADLRAAEFSIFQPTKQVIQVLIEFPDGHPRPLLRTAFYVDGILVDENTAEPFDQFTWNLSGYTVSGEHSLQVEAVDNLGLKNVSLGLPVTVTVIQPERGILPILVHNHLWLVLGAVLLAGVALGVTLALGHRKRVKKATGRKSRKDPLTQPVQTGTTKRGLRLPWRRPAKQSDAYLVRLKDSGEPITAPPIPVTAPEMTFGSDPMQAMRILDDPSVSPLHARLLEENGEYVLKDENSESGTWVNYEPLTAPRRLQHGDVLHLGRISYRFMLRKPPEQTAPRLTPLKE